MAPQAAESIMAQNAAAQREPSMEEILASIRRIIEDSDGGKPDEGAIPSAANVQSVRDIEAYRDALRDDEDEKPAAPPAFAAAPVVHSATVSPLRAMPEPAPEQFDAAPEVEAAFAGDDAEADDLVTQELLTSEDLAVQPPAAPVQKNSIISEAAGRQVAAAFDELSEALMASRRRSFDEIAEEMIRPMLQDWLDNNLPTLVERLVREEIERVARGPAR